ncbi:MAG: 50S ribosomal protein L7Ae [Candidatus Hydrothermarchaeales archaeon]
MAKLHVRFEMPKDLVDKTFEALETARASGKVVKGTNEVTKVVERQQAVLVVIAEDVEPVEVVAHLPVLCDEKKVPYAYVPLKDELGKSVGMPVSTSAAAIVKPGKAKDIIEDIIKKTKTLKG